MPLLPKAANTEDNNETQEDRSPFPAGDYLMHIVKTEMKQTKAKTGHYLSIHFKILEGDYAGRMMFTNLNLDNPNPVAVDIANKELNSICQACGLEGVEDSDELLQIPMVVTAKVDPGDAQWPPSNAPTKYQNADAPIAVASDTPADNAGEESKTLPWS
jgi:hypothetical protein